MMSKRQIIGIGETIVDIIFKDNQPIAAKPGGSAFNTLISIARLKSNGIFISEVGSDKLGEIIRNFLIENNLPTEYIACFPDGKTPIALAFLNNDNNAEYTFYKDYPKQRLNIEIPPIAPDDIVIFGAFFSLNPAVRHKVLELIYSATENKAIIYYDPNFRTSHLNDLPTVKPLIEENFSFSDIVRGSDEDFFNIYGEKDIDAIYSKISSFCPNFICTAAEKGVHLRTKNIRKFYPAEIIQTVSTIGAGDSFNAGILYALSKYNISKNELHELPEEKWDILINHGMIVAADVCQSYENYISEKSAEKLIAGD